MDKKEKVSSNNKSSIIHPDKKIAASDSDDLRASAELAPLLGVDVVNCFGGCPGAGEDAKYPNWITCPWPTYFGDAVKWQWEEKLVPFWKDMEKLGKDTGVRFGLEMHPGDTSVMFSLAALYLKENQPEKSEKTLLDIMSCAIFSNELFEACGVHLHWLAPPAPGLGPACDVSKHLQVHSQ